MPVNVVPNGRVLSLSFALLLCAIVSLVVVDKLSGTVRSPLKSHSTKISTSQDSSLSHVFHTEDDKDHHRRRLLSSDGAPSPAEQSTKSSTSTAAVALPNIPAFAIPYPDNRDKRYEGLTPDAFDKLTDEQLVMLRPPRAPPNQKIFFNHIPKCGGTSIATAIRNWAKARGRKAITLCASSKPPECQTAGEYAKKDAKSNQKVFSSMRQKLKGVSSVNTHRGHGWLEFVGDKSKWATVTVMREPLSWLRSDYNYIITSPHPKKAILRKKPLEKILEDMESLGPYYYDRVTRLCALHSLAEKQYFVPVQTYLSCGPLRCNCTDPKIEGGSNVTATEALMYAKQHLLRETHVLGDLSDMTPFQNEMTELCPGFGGVPHKNTKSKKMPTSELTAKGEALARKVLWADVELYEFARRVLKATAMHPHLRAGAGNAGNRQPVDLKLENARLALENKAAVHEIERLKAQLAALASLNSSATSKLRGAGRRRALLSAH